MGKRRLRNFLKLGFNDIIGFDTKKDRLIESKRKYHISTTDNLNEAVNSNPDLIIISTPPDNHLEFVKIAVKHKIPFFTELNLLSHHVKKIQKLSADKNTIGFPSCTMKFHPMIKELKKIISKNTVGKILFVRHHSGQYLPYWHPWEDYKKFFVSKKETGGARELVPIELMWLIDLFGDIDSVFSDVKKLSSLDVKIDDSYQTILNFRNGVKANLSIDVFSIPPRRESVIIGEKGTILCDFTTGKIKISKGNKWLSHKIKFGKRAHGYSKNTPSEFIYEEETKSIIETLTKNKKYPYTYLEEFKILKILDSIEKSSELGKRIKIY